MKVYLAAKPIVANLPARQLNLADQKLSGKEGRMESNGNGQGQPTEPESPGATDAPPVGDAPAETPSTETPPPATGEEPASGDGPPAP